MSKSMSDSSHIMEQINAGPSKLLLRLLVLALVLVLGGFVYFYQSIPEDNLERLIGLSRDAKSARYQGGPPSVHAINREDLLAKLKDGLSTEEYIVKIESAYVDSVNANRELEVKVAELARKVEKQKQLINKILNK